MNDFRVEKDLLGEKKVPVKSYYGIHTVRAMENFPLSERRVSTELVRALAQVKRAAAQANSELGYLSAEKANAIIGACNEIVVGNFNDQFPADALQGGAGTSTNMNINEVIANRALEILGHEKGDYGFIHPLETVNLHQSTNDVYPTALKVAIIDLLRELNVNISDLQRVLQLKEDEFAHIVKIGHTEMQEAVPLTLGAEFGAFAEAVARDRWRTFKCEERLRIVNIGGTAVGTGLTAPRNYIFLVIEKLREITGIGLSRGENCIDQTANADAFVEVSGILKAAATNLIKLARDLRLLHFMKEISLPELQAGSSIMPGKINPVICEAVIQASMRVKANDMIIAEAVGMGTLQINEFMPLIADSLLEALNLLNNAVKMLTDHVKKITANAKVCEERFVNSPTLITALLPYIGYDKASELVKEFREEEGLSLMDFLVDRLGEDVKKVFKPMNLTSLGYR